MAQALRDLLLALEARPETLRFRRGIEREALRVNPDGQLALTPHPALLGSKLTHPSITTDFSESQLELITSVSDSIEDTLQQLDEIHRFVAQKLTDEILWSSSMPCLLPEESQIPLADYGPSNQATYKKAYRNGLGHRYGRGMQTICAVHYNFSVPDALWQLLSESEGEPLGTAYRSRRYFDLIRNFRRLAWLPIYLFGASPAVCRTFVQDRPHPLQNFDEGSLYSPNATSLRSSDLGYQSDTQGGLLNICFNGIELYVAALAHAICTPHAAYEEIGLTQDGEYLQLNTNILQIEAEFYTNIRAKCVPPPGTNFLKALKQQGVEYVEVRLLDVNPFTPLGIDAPQIRFLDMLLLHSLLLESPQHDQPLCSAVADNVQDTVWNGRDPDLKLEDIGTERTVREWGREIIEQLSPLADTLDRVEGGDAYAESLTLQQQKLDDPRQTPSGRILSQMSAEGTPYFRFAMNRAVENTSQLRSEPLATDRRAHFEALAAESLKQQQQIDRAEQPEFAEYLEKIRNEYRDLL